tara:strand:+ start:609 stop:785 length:177 start_codon:yes stop_codon:yes gene_type:complete
MIGTDTALIIINISITIISEIRKSRCTHLNFCGCIELDRRLEDGETETHIQENPPEYE